MTFICRVTVGLLINALHIQKNQSRRSGHLGLPSGHLLAEVLQGRPTLSSQEKRKRSEYHCCSISLNSGMFYDIIVKRFGLMNCCIFFFCIWNEDECYFWCFKTGTQKTPANARGQTIMTYYLWQFYWILIAALWCSLITANY